MSTDIEFVGLNCYFVFYSSFCSVLFLQFQNLSNLSEGDIAHFEASLTPVGDQTMVVEWFYKGDVLKASKFFSKC
jgi:hypothetical protein